jgi:hypothetical protein
MPLIEVDGTPPTAAFVPVGLEGSLMHINVV